ncbi:PREDICTED: balbiani ring protein 3-like isoform X2 [Vollenhovia emeryi]|uniref:balbiani ring protein 3-like isoform X2 n=1 Tax=Vollenhovia emeryi TaxID=411798 RepID=UPI0005F447D7|nr:PREDICTED: balbiani ring protein 3-like isoform X2 [Vollenhovia emeryi]
MKFLATVCALMTICVCITNGMLYDDELRPHEGVAIECAGRRMQLNHQMKEVMCVPRHTMIKLIPQPGYTFYPNYASVKRCSGFCPRNKSCMPVRKDTKKIAVRMDGYDSSGCYHVLLEEHTKCKCQCSVKESDCNVHQIYSEDNCACECKNTRECDKARQMIWNEKLCKCTCNKEEEICSRSLI